MQPDDSLIDMNQGPHDAGLVVSAYPHIAEQVFGRPLLIQQTAMEAVLHALAPRMGFQANGQAPELRPLMASNASMLGMTSGTYADGGYYVMPDGTALVSMVGKMANRLALMDAISGGMTSYASIERQLALALKDPDVTRIVMEVDSPGGTVAGAFDFADRVYESRGSKPIIAAPSEMAASAAYLVASAADEIVLPQTAMVGSVGVVIALLNREKAMQKAGLAMTYIYAGEKKVDGNPYQALPDRVRAELQDEIDATYALFVDRVAKYRRMSADAIRATQAGMFTGQKAVDAGMADRVDSFANVVKTPRRFAATSSPRSGQVVQSQENQMTDAEKAAADKAVAEARTAALAEGQAAGAKAGASAERARIEAILSHPEAEGRADSAKHLAFKTEMDAAAATSLLATMPKVKQEAATPPPAKSALERAMAATNGGAGIGMDAGDGDPTPTMTATDVWARVIPN